jgi:hypothetical protein
MTLGPDARALLDAAGGGDDPSLQDAARVRAKLAARLAVGTSVGAAATAVTKSAAAGAGSSGAAAAGASAAASAGASAGAAVGVATKALLVVALIGGMAATGAIALRHGAPIAAQTSSTSVDSKSRAVATDEPRRPNAPPTSSSIVDVRDLPPAATSSAQPERTTIAAPATTSRAASSLARTVPPASEPSSQSKTAEGAQDAPAQNDSPVVTPRATDSIAEEAALLRAANTALARGDPATALARLDEHASRFPPGTLSEERDAARVFALCASGRSAAARAAASTFVAANPRSPHAAQVRRSCATSTAPTQ